MTDWTVCRRQRGMPAESTDLRTATLADLRFQSNEMLPVFKLPNEILDMISTRLRPSGDRTDIRSPLYYPIIALSQASRRWRNIALDTACAACWSRIPFTDVNWTRLCLERSRSSSISIQIFDRDIKTLNTVGPLLKPHMARLDSIALFMDELENEQEIPMHVWELLCCSLPSLASLEVAFTSEVGTWVELPSRILARQNPVRLTSVDLTFCDLGNTPHILHAPLTRLSLNNCAFWSDIDDMLDSLRGMPMLESFLVTDSSMGIVEELTPRADIPLRSIPMRHLRDFHFEGVVIQAITVFQYIDAPVHADLTFSQWVRGAEESTHDELTRISAALLAHFKPVIDQKIYPGHLNAMCSDGLDLYWKYTLPTVLLEQSIGLPPLENITDNFAPDITITLPFTDDYTATFFWPLAAELFRGVTSLKLNINDWSPRGVSSILRCFPHARFFKAEGATLQILLRELRGATIHSALSRLETLEIVQASFSNTLFARFLASLPIRPSEQGRLKKVLITECDITTDSVDALIEHLGTCVVVWDRKTRSM